MRFSLSGWVYRDWTVPGYWTCSRSSLSVPLASERRYGSGGVSMGRSLDARYTSAEAAAALGLSYRSLVWAIQRLGFEPSVGGEGSGKPRKWSIADILAVKAGRCALERGVCRSAIRRMVLELRRSGIDGLDECPALALGSDPDAADPTHLALPGKAVPPGACEMPTCWAEIQRRLAADGTVKRTFDPGPQPAVQARPKRRRRLERAGPTGQR
jgi:hypothetical protein